MFEGVRVLEFGQYIAGPVAGMLLADQGADVVKVEHPDGDPVRDCPAYHTWNRGKRVVRLDLKSADGVSRARALAAEADVVIDSVGVEALGLGADDLTAANPGLVWCSLPGFAPEYGVADGLAWEPIVAAAGGLFQPRISASDAAAEPVYTPLPFASVYAGIVASNAVAAALVARARGGRGQRIDVPLHSALFLAIGYRVVRVGGKPTGAMRPANPLVTTYECADGRWVQLHAATPRFIAGFVAAAGLAAWREEGLLDRERLATDPAAGQEIARRLREVFKTKAAAEWENELAAAGLCCAVCRTVDEWLVHPHAEAARLIVTVPTPLGPMRQPGRLIESAGTAEAPLRPAEAVAADSVAWSAPRFAVSPSGTMPRRALEGIRVLDLCLILAGPTCARTLAEFGADVIKIDAPAPLLIEPFWIDTNRGKRSMVLDLKTERGLAVLWQLIGTADVVVENFRRGVAERLGLGYAEVARRHPRVIYASMNCYGHSGPWADRPGWEQLAQATSGMQTRYGGRDGRPNLAPYAVNDYAAGLSAALGVLGALYERERTGRGQRVTTALAAAAGLLQSVYGFDYPGYARAEIEGQAAKGASALSRLYRTADDWLYLHCPPAAWPRLSALPDFADLPAAPDAAAAGTDSPLAVALARRFSQRPVAEWLAMLEDARVPAARVANVDELPDDPRARAAGLIASTESPHWGTVEHVGIPHRLSLTPAVNGGPTPPLGADTAAILSELGYTAGEITRLVDERVVAGSA